MKDPAHINSQGQPIGVPLAGWSTRPLPPRSSIEGRFCRLEILDPARHGAGLFAANQLDTTAGNWTYLPYGPFESLEQYMQWLEEIAVRDDPLFHTVIEKPGGDPVGIASLMRIEASVGVIETGHLHYSPRMQKKPSATEAMYLLMRRVFDELGYRRYEWKCDSLNGPSRAAAERLGFKFEGVFRQATIYKNRNRDTAWFSIIDSEWPGLKYAFEQWLDPANFDEKGSQRQSLAAFR